MMINCSKSLLLMNLNPLSQKYWKKMIAKNRDEKMLIMIFGKSVPIFKLLRVTLLEVFPDLSTKIFVLCLTIQFLENASFLLSFEHTEHSFDINTKISSLVLGNVYVPKNCSKSLFHMNPNP